MKGLTNFPRRWIRLAGGLFALAVLANASEGGVIVYTDFTSFNAATSTTLVEDFESIPAPLRDTPLPVLVHNGNIYTGLAGTPFPNVYVASPGYTNFGVQPATTTSVLTANGDEDFTAAFGSPPIALGFDTYLNSFTFPDGHQAHVQVFGSSGLLATVNLDHSPLLVGFLGLVATEPIISIRWTTVNGGIINTGIDNIREGTAAAVPEPATLALFGIGSLGLVGYARGRRNRAAIV